MARVQPCSTLSRLALTPIGITRSPAERSAYGQAVRATDDALRRKLNAEKEELAQR